MIKLALTLVFIALVALILASTVSHAWLVIGAGAPPAGCFPYQINGTPPYQINGARPLQRC